MNQSFETQVRIAIRALSDVIAPALAGADKHVVEQLQLTIATLGFVADRIPEATVWVGPRERHTIAEIVEDGPVLLLFYLFDWTST